MERFALQLKLRKKFNLTTVENCGYYIKMILKKSGTIIQGFCKVPETGEKLRYYWVEDDEGTIHDVAFGLACVYTPEVKDMKFILTKEPQTNFQTDPTNDEIFELYQKNPKEFWKKITV
jgi:hypothetical protein